MAKDINSVVLTGRIVRDSSLKNSKDLLYTSNCLAVNGYKEGETSFIDFTAFNKVAEIINKYARKGSLVAITGSIKQEKWTTQTGDPRSKLILIVDSIKLIDTRSNLDNPNNDSLENSNNNSESGNYNIESGDLEGDIF